MVMVSPYPVQILIKNTFLHFNINDFNTKTYKRSASAPPHGYFSERAGVSRTTTTRKRKRVRKKVDEDEVLDEFVHLARIESWALFGKRLLERQEKIERRWDQLKSKLLEAILYKKKKRCSLTQRLFINACPLVHPAEILHAHKKGFFRPVGLDSMELWASDSDLISKSPSPIFWVFMQFSRLLERGQVMMMLPCETTLTFGYRRDIQLDELRAKVKSSCRQPYDKQKLICQGQELKGACVLGDLNVRVGDVISVIFI